MSKENVPATAPKAELVYANEVLVEEAYKKVNEIFTNSYKEAIVEVGTYLINEFFDGDYDRARTLKQQLPEKERKSLNDDQRMKADSFYELTKKFSYGDMGSPSKSWLYNAVKLAVQDHDFKDTPEYELLNVSKRILLFPLKENELKTKYIPKIAPQDVTISKAKEILSPKRSSSRKGFPYYIKHPDLLFSKEFNKLIAKEPFDKIGESKKKQLIDSVMTKKEEIEKLITKQRDSITNLEKLVNELNKQATSDKADDTSDENNV